MRPNLHLIHARDNGTCWLCSKRVPPPDTLPATHPRAPSRDHIIPRAHRGPDALSNTRLAHRICNTRRGCPLPRPDDLPWQHFRADDARIMRPAIRRLASWWQQTGQAIPPQIAQYAGLTTTTKT